MPLKAYWVTEYALKSMEKPQPLAQAGAHVGDYSRGTCVPSPTICYTRGAERCCGARSPGPPVRSATFGSLYSASWASSHSTTSSVLPSKVPFWVRTMRGAMYRYVVTAVTVPFTPVRSEEHTSELQSLR